METTSVNTPKRRRLRISIRVMMLLVLVLGLWMGDRVNKAREQREAVATVTGFRGSVAYDWEVGKGKRGGHPPAPIWLLRLLGDEYFQEVADVFLLPHTVYSKKSPRGIKNYNADRLVSSLSGQTKLNGLRIAGIRLTDNGMKKLRRLRELQFLSLWSALDVSDEGVRNLEPLKHLTHVQITDSKITDSSLATLAKLPNLEHLDLRAAHITDAGLAHLRHLKNLRELDLQETLVTDAGLEHLRGLTKLGFLSLVQTGVTDDAKKRFKSSMPSLKFVE